MTMPTDKTRKIRLHPLLTMLAMIMAAIILTHFVPAGQYDRHDGKVVAGSYESIEKANGLSALLSLDAPEADSAPASAAGIISFFVAIPEGMTKASPLIFMVMFVGGMFGILQATGAVDAGINRLLHLTSGNAYLLTGLLMFTVACGASFLGLFSEYIAIVPLVLLIAQRLALPNVFAVGIVILGAAIGYSASVTNPIVLAVAQPLAGVPVFSGLLPRLAIFLVMFVIGYAFMAMYLRRVPKSTHVPEPVSLTTRQLSVVICLALGTAILVIGTGIWSWETTEHGALFIAWAIVLGFAGGLRPGIAADAFLDGMKLMLLPAVMIGLAGAIAIILQASQVLDSVVHVLAVAVEGHSKGTVAGGILIGEMMLDILVNSTSAKAAISLPILTPIAQISGIGGNVSVSALTMAGSLTNMITPTNGALLAFLAVGKVDYLEWARFVFPLFLILFTVAFIIVQILVLIGA